MKNENKKNPEISFISRTNNVCVFYKVALSYRKCMIECNFRPIFYIWSKLSKLPC